MPTLNNKTLLDPELLDTLMSLKQDIFRSLNCVKPGQIQSFDPATKTAQVQILLKRVVPDSTSEDGETIKDYPVLVDCPVFTLQGGGGAIQFPIAAGDQCLVLFSDRNLDAWFQTGSAQAPFDARCHDLSDGIVLVGVNAQTSDMPDYEPDQVSVFFDDASLDLQSGTATLTAGDAELSLDGGDVTITAGTLTFEGASGAEIEFDSGLIAIRNNITSLKTLLNGLIDVIAAATVQTAGTPPLTAVTITALQAYKLQIATLLAT